ncbi:cadmium resistance transporter [Spirulina sp. CCNP1310]|uniref:cadmium resistance transporter n=1 Tax=Spirulina sp. CCNP1310 TaxID=3110249 RepID=UPI002B20C8C7|nr:cadmium resistance transporter [Spirulina sp. CCNP1310]MEA5419216.1 cadmium resistance transporter [Spirulina sp. CCNP1310]
MIELFTALIQGITAFTATNLDDIVILMLLFSQVGVSLHGRQIVAGQYLGIVALILISLPGFLGASLLPRPWIGLLGILPIVIGFSQWFSPDGDNDSEPAQINQSRSSGFFAPQTLSIAAITIANGGDNVGIYLPLFASVNGVKLVVILAVFLSLVGLWCYGAYRLARLEAIAKLLTRYGDLLVPFVLIGLGVLILIDSHTLEYRGLTALALSIIGICLIHLMRNAAVAPLAPGTENLKG